VGLHPPVESTAFLVSRCCGISFAILYHYCLWIFVNFFGRCVDMDGIFCPLFACRGGGGGGGSEGVKSGRAPS
jgi:hypothetical protein